MSLSRVRLVPRTSSSPQNYKSGFPGFFFFFDGQGRNSGGIPDKRKCLSPGPGTPMPFALPGAPTHPVFGSSPRLWSGQVHSTFKGGAGLDLGAPGQGRASLNHSRRNKKSSISLGRCSGHSVLWGLFVCFVLFYFEATPGGT